MIFLFNFGIVPTVWYTYFWNRTILCLWNGGNIENWRSTLTIHRRESSFWDTLPSIKRKTQPSSCDEELTAVCIVLAFLERSTAYDG